MEERRYSLLTRDFEAESERNRLDYQYYQKHKFLRSETAVKIRAIRREIRRILFHYLFIAIPNKIVEMSNICTS